MKINPIKQNGVDIAIVESEQLIITDVQSALDLLATVNYETGSSRIVLDKTVISEPFFDLKTRIAGDILQKFINYQTKLAIVGDFSVYTSKSLKNFMYECNNGRDFFFVASKAEALERLSKV